jgi:flagellar biosynthesis/type III secretory pathway protein FliH
MKYNIFLKRPDGTYKVSVFESEADEASRQLSLYLFRHYPVSFFDDMLDKEGDNEKVLKDSRTGKIVWREGELNCRLEEGYFFVEEKKEEEIEQWWKNALPTSKKISIELDIQHAWKKGFAEGYAKGIEEGREEGYRQGIHNRVINEIIPEL